MILATRSDCGYIGQPIVLCVCVGGREFVWKKGSCPKPVAEQEPLASVADDEVSRGCDRRWPVRDILLPFVLRGGEPKVISIEKEMVRRYLFKCGLYTYQTYLKNAENYEGYRDGNSRYYFASTKYSIDMNQLVEIQRRCGEEAYHGR